MKRTCMLLCSLLALATAMAQSPGPSLDLIVQLDPSAPYPAFEHRVAESGLGLVSLKRTISARHGLYLVAVEGKGATAFSLDRVRLLPGVASAFWDLPISFRDSLPNDPHYPDQWHLERIGLPQVWDVSRGGNTAGNREVVVAVIDNGFDIAHEDLVANLWTNPHETLDNMDNDSSGLPDDLHGWNFNSHSHDFPLNFGHGTSVAGVIGGRGNNGIGATGVNWDVKLMLLHFQNTSEGLDALLYVLRMRELYNETNGEKGAFIVATNGSWGLKLPEKCEDYPFWGSLYDELGKAGVLSVAAAPNDLVDNQPWNVDAVGDMPTSCPSEYLITVTGTNQDDRKVPALSYGANSVDLAAPAEKVFTTLVHSKYGFTSLGNSFASPQVAGAVALLYTMPCPALETLIGDDPAGAARLIRDAVLQGVEPLPSLSGLTLTGGRLDVFGSMQYLHGYCVAKADERADGRFENYIAPRGILQLYPNPASDEVAVVFSNDEFDGFRIRVFNALGQEMIFPLVYSTSPFVPQVLKIDVSDWPSGAYYVNIYDRSRKLTGRFFKLSK